ncbi:Proline--tRNA ligase [Buchnera aphidicola (Thelaxes suberi)]|uniref:proline--tRNA ligase n=1 Tax=Buchnera aphidicola TaxID=9 RepID=UPI0034640F64
MRTSQYLLSTLKEIPHSSEIISHQLMIRAGLIRQLSSGIYTWMPTGVRVLKKLNAIIKYEIDQIGGIEVNLPNIQPIKLWKKTNRWKTYGNELFTVKDRNNNNFVLGPTHEEVITTLVKQEIKSYKELPLLLYQTKTKFRDEIRPQFGIIRTKEFIMHDAYSFHNQNNCLFKQYEIIKTTYKKIFSQINLNVNIITADPGSIGGKISHEFRVIINNSKKEKNQNHQLNENYFCKLVNLTNIFFIKYFTNIKKQKINLFACLININDKVCLKQIANSLQIKEKLYFATLQDVQYLLGEKENINFELIRSNLPLIIEKKFFKIKNFNIYSETLNICFINNKWKKSFPDPIVEKINQLIKVKDNKINENNNSTNNKTLEIAHIFQIGTKYSKNFNLKIKNQEGINEYVIMGCYGIGVTRTIAAVIEQNFDNKGIIWPIKIAPFIVSIIPINMYYSKLVKCKSEFLYNTFNKMNIDVLLNDKDENTGVMFSNMDLIGIPYHIIVSEKYLIKHQVELQLRKNQKKFFLKIEEAINFIKKEIFY